MNSLKPIPSVALFPLCDARGILMDALRDNSDIPATRGDALVFAWRLELPEGMNVCQAANAVLVSALSVPRSTWTRRQLLILRELMVLAGREEALPSVTGKTPEPRVNTKSTRSGISTRRARVAPTVSRNAAKSSTDGEAAQEPKQEKDWWKLVGRDDSVPNSRQRKTRTGRVSREP